jgi:hypothetical protein
MTLTVTPKPTPGMQSGRAGVGYSSIIDLVRSVAPHRFLSAVASGRRRINSNGSQPASQERRRVLECEWERETSWHVAGVVREKTWGLPDRAVVSGRVGQVAYSSGQHRSLSFLSYIKGHILVVFCYVGQTYVLLFVVHTRGQHLGIWEGFFQECWIRFSVVFRLLSAW